MRELDDSVVERNFAKEPLTKAEIRAIVVNARLNNPDTIMPGFHKVDDLNHVLKKFRGKPILTAQEVEDVVAYLVTLKE